jgi:hypothetical protein
MATVKFIDDKGAGPRQRVDLKSLVDQSDVNALVMKYDPDRAREVNTQNEHAIRSCCPFPDHDDKSPSFRIFTTGLKKGKWVCSCGTGNLFDFVMRAEQVEFKQAINHLKGLLPGGIIDSYINVDQMVKEIDGMLSTELTQEFTCPTMPICERNYKMIAWYMHWRRRYELDDAMKIIHRDGLLWCSDQTPYSTDKIPRGMVYASSIIIPMHDDDGKLVYWQAQYADGRSGKNKMYPAGQWNPTLLPGMNLCRAGGYRWALLVEGYWDMVRAWHYGVPAIATCSSFVNDHQMWALYKHLDKLVTAYDNDNAGRDAAQRVEQKLGSLIDVHHLNVRHKSSIGKLDVDEMQRDQLLAYIEGAIESAEELERSVSENNQK